jgi:2-polyprenyl-3-methyl-5-hydroxy-6-metoxy-1,4-benzoquinol methylase
VADLVESSDAVCGGLELARKVPRRRVLDYGSGDGAFLALLMSKPYAPSEAIGGELHRNVVDECEARLGTPRLRFVLIDDLDKSGSFDQIFCMEVLEHVVELQKALGCLERLLAPEGKLLVSVPVETGLPLILKQTVRRIAGWWRSATTRVRAPILLANISLRFSPAPGSVSFDQSRGKTRE